VFWNEIAQSAATGGGSIRSQQACRRSASPRKAFPAICWPLRPASVTRTAAACGVVHAVLAAAAGAGAIRQNFAGTDDAAFRTGHCERCARAVASRTKAPGTGPTGSEAVGHRARSRPNSGSMNFWKAAWPVTPATATGLTVRVPPDCRRICALARSARARSGTPTRFAASERPALSGDIDKFLSECGAGANSAAICCSTCQTSQRAICSTRSNAFPWRHDDQALAAWQHGQTGLPDRRCRDARALAYRGHA